MENSNSTSINELNNGKRKVLIVDNDDVTREFVEVILKKNFYIDKCDNGPDAIKLANDNSYSLILMDIGLGSGMNGIEAAKEIKKIPSYQNIPIIALTAYAMKGDKENFLSKGLTHYISKPFLAKELLSLINEII